MYDQHASIQTQDEIEALVDSIVIYGQFHIDLRGALIKKIQK